MDDINIQQKVEIIIALINSCIPAIVTILIGIIVSLIGNSEWFKSLGDRFLIKRKAQETIYTKSAQSLEEMMRYINVVVDNFGWYSIYKEMPEAKNPYSSDSLALDLKNLKESVYKNEIYLPDTLVKKIDELRLKSITSLLNKNIPAKSKDNFLKESKALISKLEDIKIEIKKEMQMILRGEYDIFT